MSQSNVSAGLPSPLPHILVTGSKGMLGQALLACAQHKQIHTTGFDLPEIDITDRHQVLSALEGIAPDLLINCAAYTAVDKAESEPHIAFAVNREGPANLAYACRHFGIPLIHISTDYVFDGTLERAYCEEDPANPANVYGQSKWEGEEAIRSLLPEHIIIRTAWLYGVSGQNFVKTIMRLAREREELRVIADQRGCPTSAHDLADCLLTVADFIFRNRAGSEWGTYHYTGRGLTTWYGFAEAITEEIRSTEAVKVAHLIPIPTKDYPTAAKRPTNSALDCTKIMKAFGVEPKPWKESLRTVISEIVIQESMQPG